LSICNSCLQYSDNSTITIPQLPRKKTTSPKPIPSRKMAPGLIDAIPIFINTSAITYRIANDQLDFDHNDSSLVKPLWYDLLLDLLTQIFSYGDIDPSDYHSDNSESDDDEDSHFAATRADDYLLWQRTPYLDEFRQKKKARMEEFLNVKGKLDQHFENLAQKYPIHDLEIEMYKYCSKVNSTYMKAPELITLHGASTNLDFPVELFQIPGDGLNLQIPDSCNHCVDANPINNGGIECQKKRGLEDNDIECQKKRGLEDNDIEQLKKRKNLSSS
ncbi:30623_t:CDS:2, partial [Racocetra persica]